MLVERVSSGIFDWNDVRIFAAQCEISLCGLHSDLEFQFLTDKLIIWEFKLNKHLVAANWQSMSV